MLILGSSLRECLSVDSWSAKLGDGLFWLRASRERMSARRELSLAEYDLRACELSLRKVPLMMALWAHQLLKLLVSVGELELKNWSRC